MTRALRLVRKLPGPAFAMFVCLAAMCQAAPKNAICRKIVLDGQVSEGQEWRQAIGHGWVFRLVPITEGPAGYSGWDLVVDRESPAGYPDALLLATPPWNSINEREVGTTFGLRAQDAIGWNPRSFHFLTDPAEFAESQKLFRELGLPRSGRASSALSSEQDAAIKKLARINAHGSAGEFRIINAHIAPGISDAVSYAEPWALASPKTEHTLEPPTAGKSTPLGELHWVRFSLTLWLPSGWKSPSALQATQATCSQ